MHASYALHDHVFQMRVYVRPKGNFLLELTPPIEKVKPRQSLDCQFIKKVKEQESEGTDDEEVLDTLYRIC